MKRYDVESRIILFSRGERSFIRALQTERRAIKLSGMMVDVKLPRATARLITAMIYIPVNDAETLYGVL